MDEYEAAFEELKAAYRREHTMPIDAPLSDADIGVILQLIGVRMNLRLDDGLDKIEALNAVQKSTIEVLDSIKKSG